MRRRRRPRAASLCGELPLRTLTRLVRDAAERAADWRTVVDGLRPHAQALWGQRSDDDKRRFVRHVRPYWDSARHRLAPDVAQVVATLRASGRLVVRAGRLIGVDERAGRLHATWRARGAATHETLVVAGIVNCTGPLDAGAAQDPVVSALIRSGHAAVGASGIGLATGSQERCWPPRVSRRACSSRSDRRARATFGSPPRFPRSSSGAITRRGACRLGPKDTPLCVIPSQGPLNRLRSSFERAIRRASARAKSARERAPRGNDA